MNKIIDLQKIKTTAEDYYRNGDFFCSESIVKTIKDEFGLPISDDIIAMASGFPEHMDQCVSFTGEVAVEAAKIIVRELELEVRARS